MINALSPDRMTAAERLDEVAEILATGVMRLHTRKSSSISPAAGESSLDFLVGERGHETPRNRRKGGSPS